MTMPTRAGTGTSDTDPALEPALGPSRRRRTPAGPVVDVAALPDDARVRLSVPADVDMYLGEIEATRQRQLDAMAATDRDPVAAAYRACVVRILAEIRSARDRLRAGLYGVCALCEGDISVQRLEQRTWATTCARCADRTSA